MNKYAASERLVYFFVTIPKPDKTIFRTMDIRQKEIKRKRKCNKAQEYQRAGSKILGLVRYSSLSSISAHPASFIQPTKRKMQKYQ